MFERSRTVADAVLFEGYLLFPYRASARKNQLRWQFGVLAPQAWCDAGGGEHSWMQTECIFEVQGTPQIEGRFRFLRVEHRSVEEARDGAGSSYLPVGYLEVNGRRHIPWDEGVPQEVELSLDMAEGTSRQFPFVVEGGERIEILRNPDNQIGGRLVRRSRPLSGSIAIDIAPGSVPGLSRVRVRVQNQGAGLEIGAPRDLALRSSFIGAHLLLGISGGAFFSAIDPPEVARDAVSACENVRAYPVLVGEQGDRSEVLASPIILYDHPEIAPESQGQTFDGTEIDELLALTTLALTDEERAEARATDDRVGALFDRFETMPREMWGRLHGAIRSVRPSGSEGQDRGPATIRVGSVDVGRGGRVRLRPGSRRADAQDMFLTGRIGRVEKVLRDFEGNDYVAVILEDDPAADLYRQQGRHLFFSPDEVEPLESTS
jgi:hypothetical protein